MRSGTHGADGVVVRADLHSDTLTSDLVCAEAAGGVPWDSLMSRNREHGKPDLGFRSCVSVILYFWCSNLQVVM